MPTNKKLLIDQTLVEFLAETAGDSPVPGGGSIAAQSGASAAALTEMVANLTIGKKNYENVSKEMMEIAAKASLLRTQLLADVDKDAESYAKVMMAYKLPKDTETDQENRTREVQLALKLAATVPLEVARKSREVIDLAIQVVKQGNKNAMTDGAVAGMLARTAALSALYNVKINLSSIKDVEFVLAATKELSALKTRVILAEKEIFAILENQGL